jgi:hypothetical protein
MEYIVKDIIRKYYCTEPKNITSLGVVFMDGLSWQILKNHHIRL